MYNSKEEWQSGLLQMVFFDTIEVHASEGSNPFFLRKIKPLTWAFFIYGK